MYKKILKITEYKDKLKILFFVIGSIVATFLELLSLSSIPIFLMSILNFDQNTSTYLSFLPFDFNNINQETLVIYFSLALCGIFLIKNIYLSILVYFQGVIFKTFQINFGSKMFQLYIKANYDLHINKNPSIILRSITSDASQSASIVLNYINLCKESLVLFGIFVMLLVIDYSLTLIVFSFLSMIVTIFFLLVKKKIFIRSKQIQFFTSLQIKTINQTLAAIKEIKLLNKENFFRKIFFYNIEKMESNRVINYFLTNLPRYFLETISIFTITLVALAFILTGKSFENFIPMLSLLAVSAIRLIPSFNTISTSLASIKSLSPSLNFISDELEKIEIDQKFKHKNIANIEISNGRLIKFKNVSFNYKGSDNLILNNLNTSIEIGKITGILGSSGAGKTTFIDIFLGLLKPSKGELHLKNININEKINSWQSQIGYVPQEINLIDDTIVKNIALGEEENSIDFEHLNSICKIVGIDQTILNFEKKDTRVVGNRGAKLSGGQIQRIGIARAIYSKPKILILDEALNSLDKRSENEILDNLKSLNYVQTIILISHNLELFKRCDNLILIDSGKIVFEGSYDLIQNDQNYNKLVREIKRKETVV